MKLRWPESPEHILRALAVDPHPLPPRTDAEAIAGDWAAVGDDMWAAVERWEAKTETK